MTSASTRHITEGVWGGNDIVLRVSANETAVEFDCAHGTIGPINVDRRGRFAAKGTVSVEHGGPARRDEEAASRPARFAGSIKDGNMTLTVTFIDHDEKLGTFALTRGKEGPLHKCY